MKRFLLLPACFLLWSFSAVAQELDCDVTIDLQPLTAQARDNLVDFVQQIKQYMNTYRWTKADLQGEKIKCAINITFLGSPSTNHYTVKAFIGSQRPIYKLDKSTAVTRIIDDQWEFDYIHYQQLTHDDYRFDPLLSFLDFYAYVMIGLDFDSGDFGSRPFEGTPYFQKASDVVNKARSSANAGIGWDITSNTPFSRSQLIDELLNPKFQDLREASFRYHYRGLDLLHKDDAKARKNILTALEKIKKLREKINQTSISIRVWYDSKYLEIAQLFLKDPDPDIYAKLTALDPSHQKTYEEYKQKR